jgi:uncharacterized repeat protein (TIGR03803 family)
MRYNPAQPKFGRRTFMIVASTMHQQKRNSGMGLRAIWSTLGILMLLVPVLVTTRPAQAPDATPTYTILYTFKGGTDAAYPTDGLFRDAAGNFYGNAGGGLFGCSGQCGVVYKVDSTGKETVLHRFTGPDGADPSGGLVRDAAGNFYGATAGGGFGHGGVVFKLDPTGKETVLHRFSMTDGASPSGGLVRDAAGNLYGTTVGAGAFGGGTVFKLTPTSSRWKETVLHSFRGSPTDGANPPGGLLRDVAGNLYGTTSSGGSGPCAIYQSGCGVIFKVSTTGKETVLHRFAGYPTDGATPYSWLARDSAGNLYGTTSDGGAYGDGAVFKLDTTGNETLLYSFTGGTDGANPSAGLFRDAAGNLYGSTVFGGSGDCGGGGCGVIFKLDASGNYTVLHNFDGTDGANPIGSLWRDAAGNFYGTTPSGGSGACTCGVVFKLTP